jgi:hypothetical protein
MSFRTCLARTGRFITDWGAIMSGALSVPFMFMALLNVSQRLLFGALSYAALLVMAISQTIRISKLREQMTPKLRMFCDDEGCVKRMTRTQTPFVFFRVAVESVGVDHVTDCKGFLTRIEKDGAIKWAGNNVLLTFAPEENEDATAKTIREKIPEYLDVVAVAQRGVIFLGTKRRVWQDYLEPLASIFSDRGEYILTIKVSGRETRTIEGRLKLCIAENYLESLIELLTPPSRAT